MSKHSLIFKTSSAERPGFTYALGSKPLYGGGAYYLAGG